MPWINYDVTTEGYWRVCCYASRGPEKGLLKDNDGNVMKINEDRLKDIRNVDMLKSIRKSMLDDVPHPECIRCNTEDANGRFSKRHNKNYKFKDTKFTDPNYIKEHTASDGTIDVDKFPIKELELRLGNKCNLKCKTCSPDLSDTYYREYKDIFSDTFHSQGHTINLIATDKKVVASPDYYHWVEQGDFFSNIAKDAPELDEVGIMGGEPLLVDNHYDLIDTLASNGNKDLTVTYATNGTTMPQRFLDALANVKSATVCLSLDATGDTFKYVRHPGNWDKVLRNLDKLDSVGSHVNSFVTPVISIYNVWDFINLTDYFLKNEYKNVGAYKRETMFIRYKLVTRPSHMSITCLPADAKQQIKDRYESYSASIDNYQISDILRNRVKFMLDDIVNKMYNEDNTKLLDEFVRYTDAQDAYRSMYFKDVCPEIANSIKGYMENGTGSSLV